MAANADSRLEYAQRVEFLSIGLEHARLTSKLMESLDMGKIPPQQHRLEAARAAMRELVAFRRAHEHLYFADLLRASRQEHGIIDVDTLLGED